MNRDGKGVEKGEDTTPNLKFYFKLLKRKFSSLLSLNILMNFQVLPLFIALFTYLFTEKTPSQTSAVFAPIYGVSLIDSSVTTSTLLSIFGIQYNIPIYNNPAYWIIGICALFLILTIGWQSVGATYVLRGLVRHDPVYIFTDYFYGIKRNFKEGFLYGLFDSLIILVLSIDFMFFYVRTGTFGNNLMFWIIAAMIVLYLLMRPYIYMMLITFNMKFSKILKNALIFAILGIKRNVMWLIGVLLVVFLNFMLIMIVPASIVIPLILPFIYLWAFIGFTVNYAIYPVIDQYMIAPYRTEQDNEEDDDSFTDDDHGGGEPIPATTPS